MLGKLKISLAECGFSNGRGSLRSYVCVWLPRRCSHANFYKAPRACTLTSACSMFQRPSEWTTCMHKVPIRRRMASAISSVPAWVCCLLADNWSLMVHLLLSWGALAAAEKSYLKNASYEQRSRQISTIGRLLWRSHIEILDAKSNSTGRCWVFEGLVES